MKHSDFIVYVDESGDHCLTQIDPLYPLFALSLCIFHKSTYCEQITPALRRLKFATFGHDMVILHETDIRKRTGAFAALGRQRSMQFLMALTDLIARADFHVIPAIIDKRQLKLAGEAPPHAYHLALKAGLKKLLEFLQLRGQNPCTIHLVCEARGAKEDADLLRAFGQIVQEDACFRQGVHFELVIADKRTNSEGLQLADLTARPMGLSVLHPDQPNRAVAIIRTKLAGNLKILSDIT